MSERLPPPDRARIAATPLRSADVVVLAAGTAVVRVHALGGAHPVAATQMRAWGPTRSRFDHHTWPRREHPTRRVAYVTRGARAFTAALAEYFQDDGGGVGPIDLVARMPSVSILRLAVDVRLLDLDGGWVTRAGGNQAIRTGSRVTARDWARAIHATHRDVAGLAYGSSVWGPGDCAVIWERGSSSLTGALVATRLLSDPAMRPLIDSAADELRAAVLG